MDPIRRNIVATGVAAATMTAAPQVFAQQTGQGGTAKFYEKGPVRIRYEEAGSGLSPCPFAAGSMPAPQSTLVPGQRATKGSRPPVLARAFHAVTLNDGTNEVRFLYES